MKIFAIALLPGDGIGPEVVAATVDVLRAAERKLDSFRLDYEELSVGAGEYLKSGDPLPEPTYRRLEQFDAIGRFRTTENGALIDASGGLDGYEFEGAVGLGAALRENPELPRCLVQRVYSYGTGGPPAKRMITYDVRELVPPAAARMSPVTTLEATLIAARRSRQRGPKQPPAPPMPAPP